MGTFQSLSPLADSVGNLGSKYIGDVGLFGFSDNADIIGDSPHTAVIDPAKLCIYFLFQNNITTNLLFRVLLVKIVQAL